MKWVPMDTLWFLWYQIQIYCLFTTTWFQDLDFQIWIWFEFTWTEPKQARKLNFFGTRPKWVVSCIAFTKFHLPRPVFHSPGQIFTRIGERASASFPACLNIASVPTPSNGSAPQSMAAPPARCILGMRNRSFNKTGFDWLIPSENGVGMRRIGCWCPGSLRRQDISSHDIDYVE